MTNPPMYNVASAVFCRSLAIVRSLPLPGCVIWISGSLLFSGVQPFAILEEGIIRNSVKLF